MAIGPVQLLVLGFDDPDFRGEIIAEIQRLRENGAVRVLDSLAVFKDVAGDIEIQHLSNASDEQSERFGRMVCALVGLQVDGEDGPDAVEPTRGDLDDLSEEDGWDVLQDIPDDTAAALVLIEHHWAVPLRDAIARASGFRISDGFISPLDLLEIGLVSADEAVALDAIETGADAR